MSEVKAEVKELAPFEKAYVRKALEVYLSALYRARDKEVHGSDLWKHRAGEIDIVKNIKNKMV